MSLALAPSPWPVPSPAAAPWRFGRVVRLAGPQGERAALRWVLKRNCSITPRQLTMVYLSLCAVSIGLGLAFWSQGAPFVLAFAGLELVLVGLALLVYARHAADRETVTLDAGELRVEQCVGRQVQHAAFRAEWLSVEPAKAQGSLVALAGQGRRVLVGRHLRPELRAAFAQELRQAVRRAQAGLPPEESELELQR
jgi:uncharacterized membrane protein